MTYTEIEKSINEGLENDRKEYRVKYKRILKNGVYHDAFELEYDNNVRPIYYPDRDLTEGFIYGDLVKDFDKAINQTPEIPTISKEFILINLRIGLCPQNREEEFKKNGVYYEKWNDLFVYYYFKIFEGGTVKITKNLMKEYNIRMSDLFKRGTEGKNANIFDMFDFLSNKMNVEVKPEEDPLMMIVSNKELTNGAGEILTDYALSKLYRSFKGAFYVLPSSIHEVIAVKAVSNNINDLRDMVKFVNNTELKPEEKLSDNIYYCDETLELRLA